MKKITLAILTATLLVASTTTTQNSTQETISKSRNTILIEKQEQRTSKIETQIVHKELARVVKTKIREEKIQKIDNELLEKAIKRREA